MQCFTILRETWRGKDIYRVLMNQACADFTMKGLTVDVGSSTRLASYHRFLQKDPGTTLECLDLGFESTGIGGKRIDLEQDKLPYADGVVDSVLMFNLLEHIYNYDQALREAARVLKPGGQLIGAVPFLVNYHPDPHDYWRFTGETLQNIFTQAGFKDIQVISFGCGPFTAGWSHVEQVVPRILKIIFLPLVLLFDAAVSALVPKMNKDRFSLGFLFHCRAPAAGEAQAKSIQVAGAQAA